MIEYATTVLIEQYGPIGALALVLWYRQTGIIRGLLTLAEQQPDVDEEKIEEQVKVR